MLAQLPGLETRDKVIKAKKSVELSKNKKENNLTAEQERSMKELDILIGR